MNRELPKRLHPTLADYAVIAISPALIMSLVGSLIFFLIEVFYLGAYNSRLNFIMAMFVMGAVLIARIAIEQGRDYALAFAIPLGIVTAIATFRFVEFSGPLKGLSPLINLGLIGLIWWCANKLTWDSTVIDEGKDASGEGLLQTVGLDANKSEPAATPLDREATTSRAAEPPRTIWQKFVERRHRPHAPGVWVIYFSLAALPIFGFGNWFIPSSAPDSRRYVFKLLVIYVASALGLLLATSFLGLRRYLRQRRLEMPNEIAAAWMSTGALMIGALLAFCLILPRRNSEYSITQLPIFAGSPTDLWTTEYSVGDEGQEDPEKADRQGEQTAEDGQGEKSDSAQSDSQQSSESSQKKSPGQSSSEQNQGQSGGQPGGSQPNQQQGGQQSNDQRKSDGSGGEQKGKSESNGQQQPGDSSQGEQSRGESGKDQKQGNKSDDSQGRGESQNNRNDQSQGEKQDQAQNQNQKNSEQNPPPGSQPQQQQNQTGQQPEQQKQQQRSGSSNRQPQAKPPQPRSRLDPSKIPSAVMGTFGRVLKFLYWLAIILIVGYVVWRYHREILEAIRNFIKSLRDFWDSLFGRKADAVEENAAAAAVPTGPPPKPFSAFSDPFLTGMAQQRPPAEVIRYSFEAFEAWGREHGYPRAAEQTPHEYAQVIGQAQGTLSREASALAELYARCAYGKDPANRASVEHLRRLWEKLRA